jgi:hypothetical protein
MNYTEKRAEQEDMDIVNSLAIVEYAIRVEPRRV